jgi:hypothetical protein
VTYLSDSVGSVIEPAVVSALGAEVDSATCDLVSSLGTPDDLLPFVATHLRAVTELVGPGDRAGFLFHCWLHWTTALAPRERVGLLRIARQLGDRLEPCVLHGPAAAAEQRYRAALAHLRSTAPPPYLLADHVNDLHLRLGVAPAVQAVAAQIVRLSLPTT